MNIPSNIKNATPLNVNSFNEKQITDQKTSKNSKFGTSLMVLSILMVAGSLIFSSSTFINNSSSSFTTNSKAAEMISITPNPNDPVVQQYYKKTLANMPDNPSSVIATATASGKIITLNPSETYPYDQITFTWEKPKTREANTEIVAYYVYFGPLNLEVPFPLNNYQKSVDPKYDGKKTDTNSITFNNLKKGQTYNLFIRSKSNSKNVTYMYGMEQLPNNQTLPAKKLFVYTVK